jgi:hypothetical protein
VSSLGLIGRPGSQHRFFAVSDGGIAVSPCSVCWNAAACRRYGMVLQQCAHFYNNIATEMIPCQKPMMLAEAVEFEKVQP